MIRLEQNVIRHDLRGLGHFGASRKRVRDGQIVKRLHAGVDLLCLPGLPIYATRRLTFERIARPYKYGHLSGGLWRDDAGNRVKIFYCRPLDTSTVFYPGDIIARCQNCAGDNKKMMPHVHVQVYNKDQILIDPVNEIEVN